MTYFTLHLKYLKIILKIHEIEEKKIFQLFYLCCYFIVILRRKRKVISETVCKYLQVIFIIKKHISNCLKALLSFAL